MKNVLEIRVKRAVTLLLTSVLTPFLIVGSPTILADQGYSFIGPEPFESCIGENYYKRDFTAEEAYAHGECFMALLEDFKKDGVRSELEPDKIYSLMQYADSWFEAAAGLGHEMAKRRMFDNRLALNFFEAKPAPGLSAESMQRVVSSEFQSLDEDADGLLDLKEVLEHKELYASFASNDLDGDGRVSEQEFVIFYGEATAAGGN